ncbi:hypothetical protein [Caldalkalibacillus mannanilyticus]|uniref:hypothetical protein n=1 Tax=Caldalkalibacillus mannanilyticus TaxID=1418 RepID=UPI00046895CE|nr:hypothetical protein [Caldalkalibacillus mannanilyticus]
MKKVIFIILGGLLSLILIAGIWGYNYFLAPDPEIEAELVNELPEGFFDVSILEELTKLEEDFDSIDGDSVETSTSNTEGKNSPTNNTSSNSDSSSSNSSPSNSKDSKKEITVQSIEAKYKPRFERLESIAQEKLEALVANAAKEYTTKQKDGKLDTTALAKKYLQGANMLENSIDATFDIILNQMSHELTENNLPTDLVKKAEQEYKAAIASKKSELYSNLQGKF